MQGSRPEPYAVEIGLAPHDAAAWRRIADALGAEASHVARLLAGEMPPEVDAVCAAAGAPLFPVRSRDLHMACSCPDWAVPCKHVAAVHYVLAEALERDPFLLFRLRGLGREALLALLREADGRSAGRRSRRPCAAPEAPSAAPPAPEPPQPLPLEADAFWRGGPVAETAPLDALAAPDATLRRLGPLPLWRGRQDVVAALAPVYRRAAERALFLLAGPPPERSLM